MVTSIEVWGLPSERFRIFRPTLEVPFKKRFSAVVTFEKGKFMSQLDNNSTGKEIYSISGWGLRPELRFYPSRYLQAPANAFVGLLFSHRELTETYTGYAYGISRKSLANVNTLGWGNGIGLVFGGKAIWWHLTVENKLWAMIDYVSWQYNNQRRFIDPSIARSSGQIYIGFETHVGLVFPKPEIHTIHTDPVPSVPSAGAGPPDSATVILYRPKQFFGRRLKLDIHVNDSLMGMIGSGEEQRMILPEGVIWIHMYRKGFRTITFNVEKGRTYYVKHLFAGGFVMKDLTYTVMDPVQAEKELEKVRRRK